MVQVLGYAMALASSAPEVAQLLRTVRLRHAAGLSAFTQASFPLSWLSWLVYGLLLRDGPVVLSAAVASTISVSMVLLLRTLGELPPLRRLLPVALGYAVVVLVLLLDARLGGFALAAMDLTMFLPQMVKAIAEDDLSGVSPLAVGWELSTSVGWVTYTVLSGIPEAGLYSTVYAAMLTVVAYRLVRTRLRSPAASR